MLQLWIQYTAALPVWNKEENDENEEDDESDDGSLSGGPDDSLLRGAAKRKQPQAVKAARSSTSFAYHLPADHPLAKGVESFYPEGEGKDPWRGDDYGYPAGQLYNDKSMNDAS